MCFMLSICLSSYYVLLRCSLVLLCAFFFFLTCSVLPQVTSNCSLLCDVPLSVVLQRVGQKKVPIRFDVRPFAGGLCLAEHFTRLHISKHPGCIVEPVPAPPGPSPICRHPRTGFALWRESLPMERARRLDIACGYWVMWVSVCSVTDYNTVS